MTDPWIPEPMPVAEVRRDTADTVTLTLDPGRPFRFAPGQFNMLCLPGLGEVPVSISGDPAEPERLVHTIRGVGSVTKPMVALEPGAILGVRGPFGTPWPLDVAAGEDVIFVGGGIGLAPLRPAILHVLANRRAYGRVLVLYGARSPADILYRDELHRWRGRFDASTRVTVDRPAPDWFGPVGVVTRLIDQATVDPGDTVVMTCGPDVMMRFVVRSFEQRGVPDERIYVSLERNMHCGFAHCGHCQLGPVFVCKDGPVFRWDRVDRFVVVREF